MVTNSSLQMGRTSKAPWSRIYIALELLWPIQYIGSNTLPMCRPRSEKLKTSIFLEQFLGVLNHHRMFDQPETFTLEKPCVSVPVKRPHWVLIYGLLCQGTRLVSEAVWDPPNQPIHQLSTTQWPQSMPHGAQKLLSWHYLNFWPTKPRWIIKQLLLQA